ncbi:hypothetical protein pb186bvf_002315 [Paramecium bursaria]
MVILAASSPLPLNSSVLERWDFTVRENHQLYQDRIDHLEYQLQQRQRLLWGLFHPKLSQDILLDLQVLKLKQQLGAIDQAELKLFHNDGIASALNRTFSGRYNLPFNQIGLVGLGSLQVLAHAANAPITWRLGLFIIPTGLILFYNQQNVKDKFQSIEFMNFLIQYRTAQSKLERFHLDQELVEKVNKAIPSLKQRSLFGWYQTLVNSVATN